jgi:hypothetical protein
MAYLDYTQLFMEYNDKIDVMIDEAQNFREMLNEITQLKKTNPTYLLWIGYQTRVRLNDVKLKEFINIVKLLPSETSNIIVKKYNEYQKTKKSVKFTYVLY